MGNLGIEAPIELADYLKKLRITQFSTIKDMAIGQDRKFYQHATLYERGHFPKKGAGTCPFFETYLSLLNLADKARQQILQLAYSFTGEIKQEAENTDSEEDGRPTRERLKKLRLDLAQICREGDAVAIIERRHKPKLTLGELAYIAEQVTGEYRSYAKSFHDLLDRATRLGLANGLIGSSAVGIIDLRDCLSKEVDPIKYLAPTADSLDARLSKREESGNKAAGTIKKSLSDSRSDYESRRKALMEKIKAHFA